MAAKIFAESGVVEYGMIEDDSTALGSVAGNVQNGDIFHIFLTDDDGEISGSRSAYFQAARAEYYTQHSLNLAMRVDSEAAEVDSEFQRIEEIIAGIHGRISDAFDVGYGLDIVNVSSTDTDIVVDTDVIASVRKVDSDIAAARAFTAQSINALLGSSPGIYQTLTRIREALDSDDITISDLVAAIDSERTVLINLTNDLRDDIDSDAAEIRALAARIDSDNVSLQRDIDSDADAIRRIDSELAAQTQEDSEIHTRIDSEIAALRQEDSELFAIIQDRLDSEGGARGSFRSLTDTPNAYGTDSDYVRMNAAEDGLRYFNPFPLQNGNELRVLNGLTIRTIHDTYIEFATFQASANFVSQTLNWDDPVTQLVVNVTNDDLVQTEYVTGISSGSIDGTSIDVSGFNSFGDYAATRQFVSTFTFLDPSNTNWRGSGNSGQHNVALVFTTNLNRDVPAAGTIEWRSYNQTFGITNETQYFDEVDRNFTTNTRFANVSNPGNADAIGMVSVQNITNDTDGETMTFSASSFTGSTFTMDQPLYSNTQRRARLTGTRRRPDDVYAGTDSDQAINSTATDTPTTRHRAWGIVRASGGITEAAFGTLSDSGYAGPNSVLSNSQAWYDANGNLDGSRRQYGNGLTGVSLYVVLPPGGTINSITESTNTALPIAQPVPTPVNLSLGHSADRYTYRYYEIPLADTSGNFYTIT